MLNEYLRKLQSNTSVVKKLEQLIDDVRNTVISSESSYQLLEMGFSSTRTGTIYFTPNFIQTRNELCRAILKVIKTPIGDEKWINSAIHSSLHRCIADETKKPIKHLLEAIEEAFHKTTIYVPNSLVGAMPEQAIVRIGPVTILTIDSVINELRNNPDNPSGMLFSLENGQMKINYKTMQATPQSHKFFWKCELNCPKEIREETAIWNIYIASSILRMFGGNWSGLYPLATDTEPYGIGKPQTTENFIALYKGALPFPGKTYAKTYNILPKNSAEISSLKVQEKINSIFEAKEKTIGRAIATALGWQALSRKEANRSVKSIHSFTSIEALLSGSNKSAPVTDTISRFTSVIWNDDPEIRANVFKKMKSLYEVRSDIVHRGELNATQSTHALLQHVAENLIYQLVEKTDLSMPLTELHNSLRSATHGQKWNGL